MLLVRTFFNGHCYWKEQADGGSGGRWEQLFEFVEKITSFACSFGSGTTQTFQWKDYSLIYSKSELIIFQIYLYHKLLRKEKYHQ